MSKTRLPLFPEEVNRIDRNNFITKKQIRKYILENHSDIADRYCLTKKFNAETGQVEKTYAWHSIIEVMNKEGHSEVMIKQILWTLKSEDQD